MTPGLNELFEAGIRAHKSGRLQEAVRLYEHILNYDANNLGALNNLGLLCAEMKDLERSEELLKRAIGCAPGDVNAYSTLGAVLNAQRKFDEAIACCERGLRLAPDHNQLVSALASSLSGAGQYDAAIALLTKRIRARPRYAEGRYLIGMLYAKLGNYDEAVRYFREATRLNPSDGVSSVSAGECLLIAGRADEAIRELEQALALNAYDVRALALKTLALAELGRTADEKWLADPEHFIHLHHLTDLGCSAEDVAMLNRGLAEFVAHDPGMRENPPEYATANGWHSTKNLADYDNQAIARLKQIIVRAFEERSKGLSQEDPSHPFVRSAPPKFHLDLWAVKMAGGGKMLPHIHCDGWLSGVYYVEVPSIVDDPAAGGAGWIKFGTPRIDIKLTKEPITRTVKPEPGLLVTFPSYFWHDTVPLPPESAASRVCLSFDLHPRKGTRH